MNASEESSLYLLRHNEDNIYNFRGIVKRVGRDFRFSLFAKMR